MSGIPVRSTRRERAACAAADALAHREPFGVWGGLTESERRALRITGARPDLGQ